MVPEDALQKLELRLKDATLNREEVLRRIREFYEKNKVQTPGIVPEDFTEAVMRLRELAETYRSAVYPYAKKMSIPFNHITQSCERNCRHALQRISL